MSRTGPQPTHRTKAQRTAEKAATIRREQEAKELRRRTMFVTLAVVGVLTLVVAVFATVQASRDTTGQTSTPPAGVVDTYALAWGSDSAPVKVDVYEDFMCPFCGQYEALAKEMLQQYVDAGDVQVRYRVVSYLDRYSERSDYSTRAMSALGVVLDTAGPEVALRFHDELYAQQPAEGTTGLSDAELVDLAVEAGADRAQVEGPIEDRKFEQWVKNASDQASKDGFTSTPSVVVDGERLQPSEIPDLVANTEAAIKAALAG